MLTAGIAGLLLLAGCGGDDEGSDADAFVADADALCAETQEAVVRAYDEAREAGGPDTDAAALADHAAAEEELAGGLAELEAPSELQGVYDEMVALQEKRAALLGSADAAFQDGNDDAVAANQALGSQYQDEVHAIARGLGMTECASLLPDEEVDAVTAAIEDALAEEGADAVEIDELEGSDLYAEAEVVATGGRYDNAALTVRVAKDEDGEWVLATEPVPFGTD